MIYPDASFLLAVYTLEGETERARSYAARAIVPFIYTPFHRLETRTALRMRVFRGHMSHEQLRLVFRHIDEDVRDDMLHPQALDWNDALREAEVIGEGHLEKTGVRSGDLLHVASAVVLNAEEFCTFDVRQAELAKRVGLKVKTWR